jgi:rhomboid protease GluP
MLKKEQSSKKSRFINERFKYLIYPYFFCSVALLILYSIFHYFFIIGLNLPISEPAAEFALPGIGAFILFGIFILRNLDILGIGSTGYYPAGIFGIAIPTIIFQTLITAVTGTLIVVKKPSDIKLLDAHKYYQIENYMLDKKHVAYYAPFPQINDGDTNQINIYFSAPLLDNNDLITTAIFVTDRFEKIIDNQNELDYFLASVHQRFAAYSLNNAQYFERLTQNSSQYEFYKNAMTELEPTIIPSRAIMLKPHFSSFYAKIFGKILLTILALIFFTAIWIILVLIPKIDEEYLNKIKK